MEENIILNPLYYDQHHFHYFDLDGDGGEDPLQAGVTLNLTNDKASSYPFHNYEMKMKMDKLSIPSKFILEGQQENELNEKIQKYLKPVDSF